MELVANAIEDTAKAIDTEQEINWSQMLNLIHLTNVSEMVTVKKDVICQNKVKGFIFIRNPVAVKGVKGKSAIGMMLKWQRIWIDSRIGVKSTYGASHMKEITSLVQEFNSLIILSADKLYERFGLQSVELLLLAFQAGRGYQYSVDYMK